MQPFWEWYDQHFESGGPWLILGKGPSVAHRNRYDLSRYHLLSLNHAVHVHPVTVAHLIDLDVARGCADVLERQAQVVVMPWHPHVNNQAGKQSLPELARTVPVLQRLAQAGRLLWYDLSTSRRRHGTGPVVRATYFSAEAAVSLLALAGARTIRTLGVDGGAAYSPDFEHLQDRTLLSNGQTTFDLQFSGLAQTILETGVDLAPLDVPSPARIYVACSAQETLPAAVLGHSIRQHASMTVEFIAASADQAADWTAGGPGILFSPRALCLADIRELWSTAVSTSGVVVPFAGTTTGPVPVAVASLKVASQWAELARRIRAGAPLGDCSGADALHPGWSTGGTRSSAGARLAHFSPDGSEPWLSTTHHLGYLWTRTLLDAVERGSISRAAVAEEVAWGHVRPSLLHQVDTGLDDPLLLPRRIRLADRGFRGPGGVVPRQLGGGEVLAVIEAFGRQAIRRVKAYWRRRRPVAGGTVRRPVPSGIQIAPSRSVASR